MGENMNTTLVGYTGFVGQNLAQSHNFTYCYNSKNITQSFDADNGLVIYSGMASQKYLANANPSADLELAKQAMNNIVAMKPEKLVLISTVDVYPTPVGVYEDSLAGGENALAYGANRFQLEKWVREAYPSALIVRLPGLFGQGIKKNFIYDIMTITPFALNKQKYEQLSEETSLIQECYKLADNGFYQLQSIQKRKSAELKDFFVNNDFNALSFTDSRSVFQFYNLANLWEHIEMCLQQELLLVNLAVEPIQASELYSFIVGDFFENNTSAGPVDYDMRTRFAALFGGIDGYIQPKEQILQQIKAFVQSEPLKK